MNRGEGLRYAAKAKAGGAIGRMFQEPKAKPKKFGYKTKTQSYAVRKNIHGVIDEGNQKIGKTSDSKHPTSTSKQNGSVNRQGLNQKNTTKTVEHKDKPRSNFIDKNKKALSKKEKIMKQADTVTLTQDQLNAILKTIGTSGESTVTPSFSIDAGELKVNLRGIENEADSTEIEQTNEKEGNESISALINRSNNIDNGAPNTEEQISSVNKDSNNNQSPRRETTVEKNKEPQNTTAPMRSPRAGQSDILSTIGMSDQNDKALMEKKKQQWRQDLDAQLAAKKAAQEKEGRGRRGRTQNNDNAEGWNPWGQPGGGAPLRSSLEASSPREIQVVTTGHPSPGRGSRGQGSSDALSQSVSSLSHIDRQKNVPAAMRSSFVIGGMTDGYDADRKRKEKEEWLRELERQKQEAKERREQEKASQRAVDSAVMQHWAEPVDPPRSRMVSRIDTKVHQVQDDIRVMSRMAAERKEHSKETEQPKSAPHNSSRSPHANEDDSPRMHIRPANALLDPAEVERRDMQKKKHLEHMAFVKAQVEENQRKKREAQALRRQEEAEAERKLAEERDRLAQDFEREQEKLRKKEEAAAARQKALAESMQNAHDAAMRQKHAERMRKLERQGHDVSNLRKSWDDQHQSPDVSPRHPPQPTHDQPYPKPSNSISFSPRREPAPSAVVSRSDFQGNTNTMPPHIQDAATSPINEVSTQTDLLDAQYISPRLIEAIRLASEGAEYKPHNRKRSDQEKGKQTEDVGRKKDKAAKKVSIKEEAEDKKTKGKRDPNAPRPKWGQSGQTKKIKNSDKDMSMSKRKREERLKKRQEELLTLQEKSAPRRASQPKLTSLDKKTENESHGRKSRADTNLSHYSNKEPKASRAGSRREAPVPAHERVMSQQQSRKEVRPSSSEDSYSTQTPPYKNGDFVPFMRTEDDELNEGTLSISPAPAPIPQHQITSKNEGLVRGEASRASRHSRQSHREMDPLLNPERLKDKEHRQEEILMQLSTLRQGLLMKQRELEIGLPPSSPGLM